MNKPLLMPSTDCAERSETIRGSAEDCQDLFTKGVQPLCQNDNLDVQGRLMDEFGRFKLWTSNIGIFTELHSSLDFRLREFKDIKEPFLRQLATIKTRLLQRMC